MRNQVPVNLPPVMRLHVRENRRWLQSSIPPTDVEDVDLVSTLKLGVVFEPGAEQRWLGEHMELLNRHRGTPEGFQDG